MNRCETYTLKSIFLWFLQFKAAEYFQPMAEMYLKMDDTEAAKDEKVWIVNHMSS